MSKKNENELAAIFGEYSDDIALYGKVALVVVVLLVVGGIVWGVTANNQQQKLSSGWEAFKDAREEQSENPDDDALLEMAENEKHEGTLPALWALKTAADTKLTTGINKMMELDRESGEKDLEEAIDTYERVVDSGKADKMVKQPCYIGLAKAYESMGKIDDAKTHYENAKAEDPDNSLGKHAQERLAALEDEDIEDWYTWFVADAVYVPPVPFSPPNPPSSLDSAPNISIPSTGLGGGDGGGVKFEGLGTSLEKPEDTTPKKEDAADDSAPTGEPAADSDAEKPAGDPTPPTPDKSDEGTDASDES